jgi:hypothetical protein
MPTISRKEKRVQMYKLIETFFSSSKTQRQFCKQNDISVSTFQFWLRLYRREKQPVQIEQAKTERSFIPIQFSSRVPSPDLEYAWSFEYPNGVRIRFNGRPDLDMLRGLVQIQAV